MQIIDSHCDAIYKLLMNDQADFINDTQMEVTYTRLLAGRIKLQCFAIYIPNDLLSLGFDMILKSADLYERYIVNHKHMMPIRNREELHALYSSSKIGALLTLEGVDALKGNLLYLPILHSLGIRSVGITWNHANWAADGANEPRGAGLTTLGKQLVKECEKLGILLDVSHLSEAGFWDLAEIAEKPFYASHSNVFDICQHPRNLKENQILEIIRVGGCIGLTFVPSFISSKKRVVMKDLLHHIEYICECGGVNALTFGSDFDGIDFHIDGLCHPGQYENLQNMLLQQYKQSDVEKWLHSNSFHFLSDNL